MAASYSRNSEEEETLFRPYSYATLYFVQSPNSTTIATVSPPHHRYSSSRGSDYSFTKKVHSSQDLEDQDAGILMTTAADSAADHPVEDQYGFLLYDDDEDQMHNKRGWIKYFSFSTYPNSACWILLQLSWRFLLSLIVALLVFYATVKPPPPAFSVKVARIGQFRLGEGVDGSGVSTKILTCNCTIHVFIDNMSNLFELHIQPPFLQLSFGHLPFAMSHMEGRQAYARSRDITMLKLSVGTRNKAMYGAGREMQDMLDSGKGLPLGVRVSLRSSYHVVWGLLKIKFHHQVECSVVMVDGYDKKHRTQVYNSTCMVVKSKQ